MRFFHALLFMLIFVYFAFSQVNYNLIDDFNRADNNDLNNGWLENEATSDQLSIFNNTLYCKTGGQSGLEPTNASRDLTTSEASFDLGSNALTGWTFHMDLNRNPSGWGTSNYSLGWVLVANENDFSSSTVDGYAVLWSGTNDELKLVYFTDGISGTDPGNTVISTGVDWDNISSDGINIRVEVTNDGAWTMYYEEGTPIANPADIDANVSSSTSNVTTFFDDPNMVYSGPIWAHSTSSSSSSTGSFDNFNFGLGTPSQNTTVQFASASGTANEGDGTYDLVVTISNPDANNATTADVVLISGDPADLGNYTTQTVTFPAGSSDDQTVTITITDDSEVEGDEDFTFELQNVSGGNNATTGTPSQFVLTIVDNDHPEVPQIVINEIMQNPSVVSDTKGEWFELYNNDNVTVDINGWYIKDDGTDFHKIDNGGPLNIVPGGYLVLGINDTLAVNGGVHVDYVYNNFILGNSSDEVVLVYSDSLTEVDRVNYDNGATFPDPNGASMELKNPNYDNNDGNNWDEAITTYGDGDKGTPGSKNDNFVSGIDQNHSINVNMFEIYQNYPNPFNPQTQIKIRIPANTTAITISIYNAAGKLIKTLFQGKLSSGLHQFTWDSKDALGKNSPSGIYFAVLQSNKLRKSIKMVLLK